jgi:hypothetical protein
LTPTAYNSGMSFTVVPLHNLELPKGTQIPFGKGFVLTDILQWLLTDKNAMGRHRQTLLTAMPV